MKDSEEFNYQRIAFNLITSPHQKARRAALKKNIGPRVLATLSQTELAILGFPETTINDIRHNYIKLAEEEVQRAQSQKIDIIFKEDECYPSLLGDIFEAPDYIYVKGNKEALKLEKLAVVGSRQATKYGWACLSNILPACCKAQLAIVSGMAYGIDSMAHEITIKENGYTIGVNAGGLLHLYPSGNIGLINRICERGCVISEFSLDIVPRPFYFPIRNRLIAGISKAILIAEAAMKSGSLITARLGLEQNRDIFAIPGRIDSPVSQGTNYLIQQGAKLITCPADILTEYGIILEKELPEIEISLTANEKKALTIMDDFELKSVDFMVDRLDDSVSATISLLMGLVLKGILREESGGYRRIK